MPHLESTPSRHDGEASVRACLLAAGGGRIDRREVRRRAGAAMTRRLPSFLDSKSRSKAWVIVGGGPSINDHVDDIRALKRRGAAVVSVNKSHDWLLDHGVVPWAHVLLDPMPWVADYVKCPRRDVRYFLASQCHDATFEALKDYPTFLWHAGQDFPEGAEPNAYLRASWPQTPWYVVPGGTTVGLRAIMLGHAMGADHFHLFGVDSSRAAGRLHGYKKMEAQDAESGRLALRYRGQKFVFDTNTHMARQQMDFDKFIADLPLHRAAGRVRDSFCLTIHGSGLLPFFAAMIGLHADPACNADPSKVGGFVSCSEAQDEATGKKRKNALTKNPRMNDDHKCTVQQEGPTTCRDLFC